jgi:hypothetical protein
MARKTLLNEQEIRKFLKLANITTVGDDQIQEMGGIYKRDDEDEDQSLEEEDMGPEEEEDALALDADVGDDMMGDAEDMMDDAEDMMGDDMMGDADEMTLSDDEAAAIIALADKLKAAMDEPGDEMEMDDEEELEPEGGDELEMAADDEVDMMEADENLEESDEDLVSEVARRVAERLQVTNQKEQMVDALAERIMKRLTK